MSSLSFPSHKTTKFALLGSGNTLCQFCNILLKNDFPKPIIVTHPKKFHKRDQILLKNTKNFIDLFEFAKQNNIKVIESEKLNNSKLIDRILKLGCNSAFSISCRSIIGKKFLKSFENRVFNIHPSLLPIERGAGILSWRIMNGRKYVAATLHQINEGIDTGDIILQEKKYLKTKNVNPEYYSIKTDELYEKLLLEFLKMIKKQKFIKLKKQNEQYSTYFSRLYTENNGAIDWNWTNKEIELFINAFRFPYPGAFTFVNDKKISILEAKSEQSKDYFHPYIYGKVIQKFQDGSIRIVTKNGFLRINEISIKGKILNPSKEIRLGDTFYTPIDILQNSRTRTVNIKDMKKPYKKNER
jgi:methionyl-tRNA formyltransferase